MSCISQGNALSTQSITIHMRYIAGLLTFASSWLDKQAGLYPRPQARA
jgi:hypothetical protein